MDKRAMVALVSVGLHASVWAQAMRPGAVEGPGDIYTNLMPYVITASGILFVFIVAVLVMRKLNQGSRSGEVIGLSMTDVSTLKGRGLLTEEESMRVRQALSRQLNRQLAASKPVSGGLNSLLADPEIRRLEALAQEKAALREMQALSPSESPQQAQEQLGDCLQYVETDPLAAQPAAEIEDVELPPDVMSMVQLGLITPEELETIKQRARAKRTQG